MLLLNSKFYCMYLCLIFLDTAAPFCSTPAKRTRKEGNAQPLQDACIRFTGYNIRNKLNIGGFFFVAYC